MGSSYRIHRRIEVPALEVRDFLREAELPGLQGPLSPLHGPDPPQQRQQAASIPHLQQHPLAAELLLSPDPAGEAALRHKICLWISDGVSMMHYKYIDYISYVGIVYYFLFGIIDS